jgi:hypothetical protein
MRNDVNIGATLRLGLFLLAVLPGAPSAAAAVETAGRLLVQLDARDASAGSETWKNTAPHSIGDFARVGSPNRTEIGGQPAVAFDGRGDAYQGPLSPATLNGDHPRSIEVWVRNPGRPGGEETMVSWGMRGVPREVIALNYGSSGGSGALTTWAGDAGWGGAVPAPDAWHHLALVFDGKIATIYDNTTARVVREFVGAEAMETAPGFPIHVGAQNENNPAGLAFYFSGALALVRVHDSALTPEQIRNNYQEDAARFESVVPPAAQGRRGRGPRPQPTPDLAATSAPMAVKEIRKQADGVTLAMDRGVLRLQVWSDRTIRVTYALLRLIRVLDADPAMSKQLKQKLMTLCLECDEQGLCPLCIDLGGCLAAEQGS